MSSQGVAGGGAGGRLSKDLVKSLRDDDPMPNVAGVVTFCAAGAEGGVLSSASAAPLRGPPIARGSSIAMRFRKLFRLLEVVAVLAWGGMIAAYVLLVFGHPIAPAAPTATLAVLICIVITTTMGAMAVRLVPSAVAAWTLGYIEGREDSHEPSHGATLLRIVNDR